MVYSGGCWQKTSVPHWLQARGPSSLPQGPLLTTWQLACNREKRVGDRSSISYELSLDVTYLPFSSILLVVLTNPDTAQKELHKDMNARKQGSLGSIWRMDIQVILSKSSCYLSDQLFLLLGILNLIILLISALQGLLYIYFQVLEN